VGSSFWGNSSAARPSIDPSALSKNLHGHSGIDVVIPETPPGSWFPGRVEVTGPWSDVMPSAVDYAFCNAAVYKLGDDHEVLLIESNGIESEFIQVVVELVRKDKKWGVAGVGSCLSSGARVIRSKGIAEQTWCSTTTGTLWVYTPTFRDVVPANVQPALPDFGSPAGLDAPRLAAQLAPALLSPLPEGSRRKAGQVLDPFVEFDIQLDAPEHWTMRGWIDVDCALVGSAMPFVVRRYLRDANAECGIVAGG
jgi:phenylpyruvate tautomerase PptA (4-oxalocrotonate tautomerase family)